MSASAVAVALLCALGVIAVFVGITYSLQMWGGKVVPNVIGSSREDAQAALAEEGFAAVVDLVADDGEEGLVLSMSPEAGSRIDEGSCVTLSVSRARIVPSVVGLGVDEALGLLSAEGLELVEQSVEESDAASNAVLEVSPREGERVSSQDVICIKVATPYTVPDVYGLAQRGATRALEEKGYAVSVESVANEDVAAGTVISMHPEPGSALGRGSTVTISVAFHESNALIEDTWAYLESLSDISFDGNRYEVMEVKDVSFEGGRSCCFTLKARLFELQGWLDGGQRRRYGAQTELSGIIEWAQDGSIASTQPSLEAL